MPVATRRSVDNVMNLSNILYAELDQGEEI
jgi:hypothetical protein